MAKALVKEIPNDFACNATAGKVTLLTPYDGAAWFRIRWISGTYGYLTYNVADGIDKGSTAIETYDSGQVYWIAIGDRAKNGLVGIASDTNSGTVEVTATGAGK